MVVIVKSLLIEVNQFTRLHILLQILIKYIGYIILFNYIFVIWVSCLTGLLTHELSIVLLLN